MRVLLINGNRTQAVTDICVAHARAIAGADMQVTGVTAEFGANIVTCEPENLVASLAVLELLAAHHHAHDAAILAISFDSGLAAARALSPIPVIGMSEAALNAAAAASPRIGVIVFGAASLPLYRSVFAACTAGAAISGWRVIDIASVANYLGMEGRDQRVLDAVASLAEEDGISHVVICGAAMAGLASRLQPLTPSRLYDGIACAMAEIRALALLPRRTDGRGGGQGEAQGRAQEGTQEGAQQGSLALSVEMAGLSPALTALFAARSQR